MNRTAQFSFGFVIAFTATAALAWTLERHWEAQVTSGEGAAHGIYGTGSPTDEKMLCGDCHVRLAPDAGAVSLTFQFTPPLGAGATQTFAPNTQYTVTATMTGEHVRGTTPTGLTNANGFVARFETATNQAAGTLRSDTTPGSCPTMVPSNIATLAGTSYAQGNCSAITHRGAGRLGITNAISAWTFRWTSPPASAGPITVWWGVVDGDGHENSLNDDPKNGSFVINPM